MWAWLYSDMDVFSLRTPTSNLHTHPSVITTVSSRFRRQNILTAGLALTTSSNHILSYTNPAPLSTSTL